MSWRPLQAISIFAAAWLLNADFSTAAQPTAKGASAQARAPFVPAAGPKDDPVFPASQILADEDGNFVPDRLGETVSVAGHLTSEITHSQNRAVMHFQDDTGGLVLVGPVKVFEQVRKGDRVKVRGTLTQNLGMEEIEVDSIRLISSGDVPKPRDVWTRDLLGERFSGQLVRLEGQIVLGTNVAGETIFLLRDERGELPLLVAPDFFSHRRGELNYALWKGGRAEVTGIAGQNKAVPPFDSGYAIIPLTAEDIQFGPPPPPPPSRVPLYTALGVAALLAILALYLWERRRIAEDRRRTAEEKEREVSRLLHELKRSQVEIRKQAAFAQLNPNPVLELFADGTITYWNSAAQETAKALQCEFVPDILPPDVRAVASECHTQKRAHHCEAKINGRTIAWSFFPIPEITSIHAYGRDITDQLSLEAQLRQAQKIESVGQLAAGVAHDFNNMLAVIQGYTSLTLLRRDLPQNVLEPLNEILSAAERASNLTRQLLTFSRKQQIELRTIDLNDGLGNLTKMLRRLLGEDIHLKFDRCDEAAWVHADLGMMEQVVMNLAINARDAMPQGGELSIAIEHATLNDKDVAKRFEARPGDFLCLTVEDTGYGMDERTMKHMFEPFFTTKEPGKGTGLGLATVHGIVKQHEGWIEVNSQPGHGTTFRVYLPAAAPLARPSSDKVIRLPVAGGTETILVVEDDPALRKLARGVLEEYGYGVYDAASAHEAMTIWRQRSEEIQLLFTDIVLPNGTSGWELAQDLRSQNDQLKVIYSTGFDSETLHRLHPPTNAILLRKPYPVQVLVRTVRECLDNVPAVQALGTSHIS
jgi:signal transduction histidine kinase